MKRNLNALTCFWCSGYKIALHTSSDSSHSSPFHTATWRRIRATRRASCMKVLSRKYTRRRRPTRNLSSHGSTRRVFNVHESEELCWLMVAALCCVGHTFSGICHRNKVNSTAWLYRDGPSDKISFTLHYITCWILYQRKLNCSFNYFVSAESNVDDGGWDDRENADADHVRVSDPVVSSNLLLSLNWRILKKSFERTFVKIAHSSLQPAS